MFWNLEFRVEGTVSSGFTGGLRVRGTSHVSLGCRVSGSWGKKVFFCCYDLLFLV